MQEVVILKETKFFEPTDFMVLLLTFSHYLLNIPRIGYFTAQFIALHSLFHIKLSY